MRDQNGFPGRIAHFRVIIMMANDHDRHSTASWSSGRMTTHGVDALVAITSRSAIDDPSRFAKSQTVVASFGLTPKKYQSGETNLDGGIRVGGTMVRTTLYEAAHIMLTRATRFCALKRWAVDVAKRRGMKRAKVALDRKLATILHRMWVKESECRWSKEAL